MKPPDEITLYDRIGIPDGRFICPHYGGYTSSSGAEWEYYYWLWRCPQFKHNVRFPTFFFNFKDDSLRLAFRGLDNGEFGYITQVQGKAARWVGVKSAGLVSGFYYEELVTRMVRLRRSWLVSSSSIT